MQFSPAWPMSAVRVPLTSPMAPLVAPAFPAIYCDQAAPDHPYHLVPYASYAAMLWNIPPDFVHLIQTAWRHP
jgi:hypothetical protein